MCVLSVFLTTTLSTSNNVPLEPWSSNLNPSPVIPDINVEVDMAFSFATIASPVMVNVLPSKVRLASAFIASVPVAVRTLLFEPFVIKSETSTEIASAATSIPVPAPTARVLVEAIVPPPVKPSPL